ncbi:outer membrane biogenesis protein BamB [Crateriforma conspicua]|uniref:Outer membrane biogenesis protein BamB n=1 Tax=Crateriforma conspicua TaxID=2527996 RepID=A0A5C5Y3J5_9PLAN|nr:outer membrane biogenesis protein BamB [Crateriforma conspicua]
MSLSFHRCLIAVLATLALRRCLFCLGLIISLGNVCSVAFVVGQTPHAPRFQSSNIAVVDDDLPTTWSPESGIVWTAEIEGYGQSTPIVAHDQIVVTSTSGDMKDNYHVTAFNSADGSRLWQVDVANPSPFKNTPMVSRAAPTAVATDEGFVAFFEGGVLIGIDTDGGKTWQRDLVAEYGPITARHGLSSSLEVDQQRVYVWVERSEEPYVLAIEPSTGETIWKSPGIGATAWASPRLIDVGDTQHLVCSAIGTIVGLDPATGERLWQFDQIDNNSSCTPIPAGNGRFVIGASDGRDAGSAGQAAASNGLIEITRDGDQYQVDYRWRAKKATCTFGSPVVVGDTAAFVNRAGVLYRLDLETGQQVSVDRTAAGGVWATPLATKQHLYLFGYKGTTVVIDLADGETVAENRVWNAENAESSLGGHKIYAAVAIDSTLVLRRGDKLYAIADIDQP